MASVNNEEEGYEARRRGWRTFRSVRSIEEKGYDEALCKNEENGVNCCDCLRCDGSIGVFEERMSVFLTQHGIRKARVYSQSPMFEVLPVDR